MFKPLGLGFMALAFLASCTTVQTPDPKDKPVVPEKKEVTIEKILVTKLTTKFPDGLVAAVQVTQYDNDGLITKEETTNGNGTPVDSRVYEKTPQGQKISRFTASKDLQSKQEVTLDSRGRVLKEVTMNPKDEIQATSEYTYDSQGNMTTWKAKTTQGNITTSYAYEAGLLKKIVQSDIQGKIIRQYVLAYDDNKNLVSKTELDAEDQSGAQVKYTTSKGKVLKEESYSAKGALIRTVEYTLDEAGYPVKETHKGPNGKVVEIKEIEYKVLKKTYPEN